MTNPPHNPWDQPDPDRRSPYPPPSPGYSTSSAGWPPPGGGYPPPPPGGGWPPPGGGYPPPPPGGGWPGGGYPGGDQPGGQWGHGYGGSSYGDLAGWWSRVGATLIDGLVLGVPAVILIFASGGTLSARALIEVVVVIGEALYFTLMLSRQGQTVGNRAVGTRVLDARTGGPLSTGKAFGRWAAQLLFGLLSFAFFIPTLLDYLWPLWDRQNQTLHDKMAGTVVIYTR